MKIKIDTEELVTALNEIRVRSAKSDSVIIEIVGERKLIISCEDNYNNMMEAILTADGKLGAQFRYTERLMYMKKKGSL